MLEKNQEAKKSIRNLSQKDFLNFGMHNLAYLKEIELEGQIAIAICAADGTPILVEHDLQAAAMLARHNDLEPVQLN
jgi:hypothetical protein